MEQQDEIIVFKEFENAMEANIAKSKLDAYGIPCFLTEENLANLYPGQHFMVFSVRLHLFANDKERAHQIMDEGNLAVDNDSTTKCPKCRSGKIERDFPKKLSQRLFSELAVLFFGIFFPKHKVYRCLDCEHEFDTA
jgi:hypothetical protein